MCTKRNLFDVFTVQVNLKTGGQKWWVYLVRCKNNSLYTGITLDVEKRFSQHQHSQKKAAKYFWGKRPLRLVAQKEIGEKSLALKVEHWIKRLKKSPKEELVNDISLIDEIIKKIKNR